MAIDVSRSAVALDPRLNAFRNDLADVRLRDRVTADRFVEARAGSLSAPSAPLKGAPDADAGTTATLLHGEPLYIYEISADGWAWVQSNWDFYVGYVRAEAVGAPQRTPTHAVSALYASVHPEPSFKRAPIDAVPLGGQVSLSKEHTPENGFLPIAAAETNSGAAAREGRSHGWIHLAQLRPLAEPTSDWIAIAEMFLAAPYVWGGETPEGIDCSGLVQIAVQATGRTCPRDSDMQAAALGRPLSEGAPLKRGDFFFWEGHVGIMWDEATLLHASAHNMVCLKEPLETVRRRFIDMNYGAEIGVRRIDD